MPTKPRKGERLTPEQRAKLVEQFRQLPKSPSGATQRGAINLLARHWGLSKDAVRLIVERSKR